MVATDIFGRGVDIDKVDFVINYDLPEESDGYLHRVRRGHRKIGWTSWQVWDKRIGGVICGEEGGRGTDRKDPGAVRDQGPRASGQDRPGGVQYAISSVTRLETTA